MSDLVTMVEASLYRNFQLVISEVTCHVRTGQVVGLVGKNGSGKTSLIKTLTGELELDGGRIDYRQGLRIAELPQLFELDEEATVWQNVTKYFQFSPVEDVRKTQEQEVQDTIQRFYLKPERICRGLSGGQKRRVLLMQTVFRKADLLILDEPTNHLDLSAIRYLEELVQEYANLGRGVLLVSHDRYFLDRVCTNILEIYNHQIYTHPGNYSQFLQRREERFRQWEMQDEKRLQFLKHEREWVHGGVKARTKRNKGRLERYYKLAEKETFKREKPPKNIIPKAPHLGNTILDFKDFDLRLRGEDGSQLQILKDFNFQFEKGYKIGLIGPNGVGKTSLMKILMREYYHKMLQEDAGELASNLSFEGSLSIGLNTVFNYFDQEKAQFKTSKSLLEFIAQKKDKIAFGNQRLHPIAYLRRFLFHTREEWEKSVNDLSGGQLTRLGLAKLFQTAANFLLLDEPTNDLDVDNLEVLERSLREFTGCVILTSHDRFFLDKVCTHTLFLQGDGYHILSTGNYTEFINKYGGEYFQIMDQQRGLTQSINDISKEETKTSSKKQSKKWSPAQKKREQNKIRKKQETVEVEIESLEKEIKDFQFKFMEPDFYSRNRGRIEELQEKLQTQEKELQKKYEQWEKLEQKVQELEG